MRELVRDHEIGGVVGEAQRALEHRRVGVHHDAVRGVRRRIAVGEIDVVADGQVDLAPRRMQMLRELRVRRLRVNRGATPDFFERRREVDVEVLGLERAPVGVGF